MARISSRICITLLLIDFLFSGPHRALALESAHEGTASRALWEFQASSAQTGKDLMHPARLVGWAMGSIAVGYVEITRDAGEAPKPALVRSILAGDDRGVADGPHTGALFGIEQDGGVVASVLVHDSGGEMSYQFLGPGAYQAACSAAKDIFIIKGWRRGGHYDCMLENQTIWARYLGRVIAVEGVEGFFVATGLRTPMDVSPRRKSKGSIMPYLENPGAMGLRNGVPYRAEFVAQRITDSFASSTPSDQRPVASGESDGGSARGSKQRAPDQSGEPNRNSVMVAFIAGIAGITMAALIAVIRLRKKRRP